MRRILIVFMLSALLVLSFSTLAWAKNWESLPSIDEVQEGDTYDKGDVNIKVFNSSGELIYSGRINESDVTLMGSYENVGNYGGTTDIWFYYHPTQLWDGSGPKGKGTTYGMALPSTDYLYARTVLYDDYSGEWEVIDQDTTHDTDADSVTTYVQNLSYPLGAPIGTQFKGETKHIVRDSANGWNDTFYTDDEF